MYEQRPVGVIITEDRAYGRSYGPRKDLMWMDVQYKKLLKYWLGRDYNVKKLDANQFRLGVTYLWR